MKFLVFNIIILCSLGYLLTSKHDENFKQWFGTTKTKITNLTKNDILENVKKATKSSSHEIKQDKNKSILNDQTININFTDIKKEIKSDLTKYLDRKIAETIGKNEKKIKLSKTNEKTTTDNLEENTEIIKSNDLKNKTIKNILSEIVQKNKENKMTEKNGYMSPQQRDESLAELITEMEIYHINGFNN